MLTVVTPKFGPGMYIYGFHFPYRSLSLRCPYCGGLGYTLRPRDRKKVYCKGCNGRKTSSDGANTPLTAQGHVQRIIIEHRHMDTAKITYVLMSGMHQNSKHIEEEHACRTREEQTALGKKLKAKFRKEVKGVERGDRVLWKPRKGAHG